MSSTSSPRTSVKEYSIIVPKKVNKKYHVMRFNATLGVEFDKWTQVKMERENNMKEFKGGIDEEQPKFGAGSEFGRDAKEEARRKKLGINRKKYKPEDQPWILKSSGSTVKKFKGIREGGVSENAAYYVFTHAANNIIQAFPLNEWYKFQPIQRYKALSAEEAEQEFTKKNKHLNYFSLMLRKRMKGDEDSVLDGEGEEGKGKKTSKSKELKISEMDEWMDSSEADSDDEDEEEKEQKTKKKGPNNLKRKKKRDTDLEAHEDSDDGDGEGREMDYITDSSDSETDTNLVGVSEEKALRKLLNSDEEESDSEKSENEEKEEEKEKEEDSEEKPKEPAKPKKKKNKKDSKKDSKDKKSDISDMSSDSSTDEEITKKKNQKKAKKEKQEEKLKTEKEPDSPNNSRSPSPIDIGKRKIDNGGASGSSSPPPAKKSKLESIVNYIPGASESGITEDAVRKYLMRKPMTTTELLQKFKSKKTGLSSEQLVNVMTQILKKINPVKQMLKGKMYLSIKS